MAAFKWPFENRIALFFSYINLLCQSTLWWIDAQRNLSHDFSSNPKKDRTVGNWKLGRKSSSMPSWKTLFYLFGAYGLLYLSKGASLGSHLVWQLRLGWETGHGLRVVSGDSCGSHVNVPWRKHSQQNHCTHLIAIHNVKSTRHL